METQPPETRKQQQRGRPADLITRQKSQVSRKNSRENTRVDYDWNKLEWRNVCTTMTRRNYLALEWCSDRAFMGWLMRWVEPGVPRLLLQAEPATPPATHMLWQEKNTEGKGTERAGKNPKHSSTITMLSATTACKERFRTPLQPTWERSGPFPERNPEKSNTQGWAGVPTPAPASWEEEDAAGSGSFMLYSLQRLLRQIYVFWIYNSSKG